MLWVILFQPVTITNAVRVDITVKGGYDVGHLVGVRGLAGNSIGTLSAFFHAKYNYIEFFI